jgi:hypothetical protein
MNAIFKNIKIQKPSPIGTYLEEDVVFLLKDITNLVQEDTTVAREKIIQSGGHYSEMLPIEYKPSKEYINLFYSSLEESSKKIAKSVGVVSDLIMKKRNKNVVLVSLARAGTPVGILIKRYIKFKYNLDVPHYGISIIRGKGIDENALLYILKNHPNCDIQFIDGWTGKGAIKIVLDKALEDFENKYKIKINSDLAVLADPGYCAEIFGTREDFLIQSACLNSTVSGLVSRTFHRTDIIKENDFHGAKYYKELAKEDVSYVFIDAIVKEFLHVESEIEKETKKLENASPTLSWLGLKSIKKIQKTFGIEDINLIKPGVGETTRVLLRRIPWKVLVKDTNSKNLKHILLLASERNVPVELNTDLIYECCGIIKPL